MHLPPGLSCRQVLKIRRVAFPGHHPSQQALDSWVERLGRSTTIQNFKDLGHPARWPKIFRLWQSIADPARSPVELPGCNALFIFACDAARRHPIRRPANLRADIRSPPPFAALAEPGPPRRWRAAADAPRPGMPPGHPMEHAHGQRRTYRNARQGY